MNEYLVTLDVYVNCHISHFEERVIDADSLDEAEDIANRIADAMEEELSIGRRGEDVWVNVSDITEEH